MGRPAAVLAVSFVLLTLPVLLSGRAGVSEAYDQDVYHLPAIRELAAQWPRVDWEGSPLAMPPFYHLLHAFLLRHVFGAELPLRLLNWLLASGLLAAAFAVTRRLLPEAQAAWLVAPLLLSSYFLGSAIWLTTDDVALAGATLAVGGLAFVPATPARTLRWGLYATVAVAVRQIHAWLALPLLWIGWAEERERDLRRATAAAALLPLALVGLLMLLWGGLTPPRNLARHAAGLNPATFSFVLSLAALFGVFYLPALRGSAAAPAPRDAGLWIAAGAGLVLALIWPTSWQPESGRYGGSLWRLVALAPEVAQRSVALLVLAPLGAVVLRALYRGAVEAGRETQATRLAVAGLGWAVAQSVDAQVFQRYYEPLLLILLGWLAALAADPARPRWLIGPALLAGAQALLSAWSLYRAVLL